MLIRTPHLPPKDLAISADFLLLFKNFIFYVCKALLWTLMKQYPLSSPFSTTHMKRQWMLSAFRLVVSFQWIWKDLTIFCHFSKRKVKIHACYPTSQNPLIWLMPSEAVYSADVLFMNCYFCKDSVGSCFILLGWICHDLVFCLHVSLYRQCYFWDVNAHRSTGTQLFVKLNDVDWS